MLAVTLPNTIHRSKSKRQKVVTVALIETQNKQTKQEMLLEKLQPMRK